MWTNRNKKIKYIEKEFKKMRESILHNIMAKKYFLVAKLFLFCHTIEIQNVAILNRIALPTNVAQWGIMDNIQRITFDDALKEQYPRINRITNLLLK